ncbi:Grx4 family monothiol glutaredoxin [Candidatus Liberibacter brunswickensis]|uniref:Grx4 family monothiol glutaredoxin n=1 Tax=Candidatus Liberibacter brunswickensis TaxID=1968796 RepID=UPI002FE3308C
MNNILDSNKMIQNEIKENDIVLFMKGTPEFPRCGFSGKVVAILDSFNTSYKGIDVLVDEKLRQGIKEYSNWPTIPQLYVKGNFIGGCDIVCEMFESGELHKILSVNRI